MSSAEPSKTTVSKLTSRLFSRNRARASTTDGKPDASDERLRSSTAPDGFPRRKSRRRVKVHHKRKRSKRVVTVGALAARDAAAAAGATTNSSVAIDAASDNNNDDNDNDDNNTRDNDDNSDDVPELSIVSEIRHAAAPDVATERTGGGPADSQSNSSLPNVADHNCQTSPVSPSDDQQSDSEPPLQVSLSTGHLRTRRPDADQFTQQPPSPMLRAGTEDDVAFVTAETADFVSNSRNHSAFTLC
jgi:hypothetical protein